MTQIFDTLNSVVRPLVKAGVGSPFPVGAGLVVVETTGHRSGARRELPLLALRVGGKVYASTVRPQSHWVRNLEATPESAVWVGGRRREATAQVQRGPLTVAEFDLTD